MNSSVLILIATIFLIRVNADIQLGCKSDPLPEANGMCPDGYTKITAGGCCPDGDVYIIPVTTTTTTTLAPTTTTTTSSGTCQDKLNPKTGVSDCPGMKAYCNNPAYVNVMKDQCPMTCGYCTGPSTCVDKINPQTGVSDCPGMKAYCNNPIYHDVMKDQCPKTCGYC
ncbi:hypothetical protein GCK72_019960 [Caenorhabditis remanei]|uniref:ShKT domain-containing protein n=1 Tax=Caenorhabditis remanei TaxID=31234 RepID=A0A6A5GFG2_CAERE|nr:hypothetical protein GCK72_019960 [Caenorhabditis remanei]KAF1753403.1 hypothetical protein GCK72_019960 [Caenorhabditis remanei]